MEVRSRGQQTPPRRFVLSFPETTLPSGLVRPRYGYSPSGKRVRRSPCLLLVTRPYSDLLDIVRHCRRCPGPQWTARCGRPDAAGRRWVDPRFRRPTGSRAFLNGRIHDVGAQGSGRKTQRGKNPFSGQTGVGLDDLVERLARGEFFENQLNGDARACNHRLSHHDSRVGEDAFKYPCSTFVSYFPYVRSSPRGQGVFICPGPDSALRQGCWPASLPGRARTTASAGRRCPPHCPNTPVRGVSSPPDRPG